MSIKRFSTGGISSATPKGSKVWDQETALGTYESIASITVDSSGASSITFSNIPQNYTHLQLRGVVRGGSEQGVKATFNDTSGNGHSLYGSGAGLKGSFVENVIPIGVTPNTGNTSTIFGAFICDILDYRNTTKYKVTRSAMGIEKDTTDNTYFFFTSGLWQYLDAINTISLVQNNNANFVENSRISLYGIRG